MTSTALLDGHDRERALAAIDAIGTALAPEEGLPGARDATLAGGHAGTALFFATCAAAFGDRRALRRAQKAADEAIDIVATTPMDGSLFGGVTGVAFVVDHLVRLLSRMDAGGSDEDVVAEIDGALLAYLEQPAEGMPCDLLEGDVGIALYALDRMPLPAAEEIVGRVLGRLEERVVVTPSGRALQGALREDGAPDLALARGHAGALALCAALARRPEFAARATPLVEGLRDLVTAAPPDGIEGHGWATGTAGVAAGLWAAGAFEPALEFARRAAAAPPDASSDDGLHDGTAGTAHVLARLARASGDLGLRDAAHARCNVLLDRLAAGGEADPSWLHGIAGVGAVLVDAVTPDGRERAVLSFWDRPLLLGLLPVRVR